MKRNPLLPPLLALLVGATVLAGGIVLARAWLPEWHSSDIPPQRFFADRYRDLAERAGARLDPGEPRVSFAQVEKSSAPKPWLLDGLGPDAAAELGAGRIIRVQQRATLAGSGGTTPLAIDFLPSGVAWGIAWGSAGEAVQAAMRQGRKADFSTQHDELIQLLLRPGERLARFPKEAPPRSQTRTIRVGGDAPEAIVAKEPILGSRPQQRMLIIEPHGEVAVAVRQIDADHWPGKASSDLADALVEGVPFLVRLLTVLILFLVLLGKRRIDFVSSAWLGAFLAVTSMVPALVNDPGLTGVLSAIGAFFVAAWTFVLWSAGESFLRPIHPRLVADLDALRSGQLGPRGGLALVYGVACGAGLAGLRLAALALAAHLPGAWPSGSSLRFPIFDSITPFFDGVVLAAGVAICLGLSSRFLPSRWAPWAAALAAGLAVPLVSLRPVGWQVGVSLAAAGLLVMVGRRLGLAALLAAAVCACLLPPAAFSALHLSWLPLTFATSAGFPAALLVLGVVGLRRSDGAERERTLRQPAFIRRMEEERRLSYEMDLLARMQRELLPAAPVLPGWELAVRSILATEAGGDLYDFVRDTNGNLWIAAGDVAGHGYSCAIVQAMTAAALTSTITAILTPSEVLKEVDRVIRRGGAHRNFTSLALVRLDPRTGEALLGNAGHPFPLLLAHGGDVAEINLPGLPLGQGPQRTYVDLRFSIPSGGALVFCSDGLFEAADPLENQYGYERPRDLLRQLGDRSAGEILEALFADWRRYMRSDGPPADDTTVLVLKRL
ncbi:MAG TPA: SpoIIE family protein phosphatase [Thermoanaerobaculia bacterium]|nr:SpoIIE family protein phosphatase [Thermoanaerobaculia bacterium]